MSTLPTGVYANLTTPLWATAGAGQEFVSPSVVVNDTVPATSQVSIVVNNDNTGAIELNTIPTGTPLNEIRFEGVTNGITLYTNGAVTLQSAPYATAILGDLFITSRQTGASWNFNNNEISYSNIKQLTGDEFFTQLGENTYTDDYGLSVWNIAGSSNKTSTINDREIYFTSTTGGTNLNLTYSFVSPLVPLITTSDPLRVTPNARTPIFPNDAIFYANTVGSTLNVIGGSGTPYSVQVTNTSGGPANGIGLSIGKTDGNNLYSTNFPFWVEITIFDPLTSQYGFFDEGLVIIGSNNLFTEIKKVGGVITGIPLNSGTGPVVLNVGDKIRAIYEWADQVNRIPRIVMTKNNTVMTTTNLPYVPFVQQYEPTFYNTTPIAGGFSYTLPFNYGNTNPIISSFNDWEWTDGLGGLYGYFNLAISPLSSGTAPNPTTYYSTVYLKDTCRFTSPPITINTGLTVTVSAYSGSKFGLGTINVYANNSLIYTAVATSSWIQGNLGTYTSTGSDTLIFEFVGAPTDTLSLQRINLLYNNEIEVLDGGMGMNGTNLNIGTGNYLSTPNMFMTSSNTVVSKPINMSNNAISNISNISATSINTNSISAISPATTISVNNPINMNTFSLLNVNVIRPIEIGPYGGASSNVLFTAPINMNFINNINNVATLNTSAINSTSINNLSNIQTNSLTGNSVDALNGGANLAIGLNSFQQSLWNVDTITGRSSSFPTVISMVNILNQIPAIPTGVIYIQVNFDGFKQVTVPLIPTFDRTNTLCYPLSPPNYLSTDGYTIAGKSVLTIFDASTLTILEQHTNNGTAPRFFAGNQMTLNTSAIEYTYKVNLSAL